jgi:DNA-binding FadR family transcriptional regulator
MGESVKINLRTLEWQKHFQEARCLFESALARDSAEKIDKETLVKLKGALDANAAQLNDILAFSDMDMKFHKIIAEASGNPIFSILYHHMSKWLLKQRLTTLTVPGQPAKALEAHKRIYEALLAHDADEAGAAMNDHLNQIQAVYQSVSSDLGKSAEVGGI